MEQTVLTVAGRRTPDLEPYDYVVDPTVRYDSGVLWSVSFEERQIARTHFVRRVLGAIPHPQTAVTASLYEAWPFGGNTLNERIEQAATAGYGRFTLGQALESVLVFPCERTSLWGKKFYFLHEDGLTTGSLEKSGMPLIITVSVSSAGKLDLSVEQYQNPAKKAWTREGGWVMRKQTW